MNSETEIFRIIFEGRENYRVIDAAHDTSNAQLAGKIRTQSLWPTVGDWVRGRRQPGDWVLIEEVLPRSSLLARKDPQRGQQILAANIDTLLIVTSANQDLNLNRLERYVALAEAGGVRPVIVINKIELVEEPGLLLDEVAARFPLVDVHGMSVFEKWNLESLDAYAAEGQTLALIGSSGVGKSSLSNVLLGGQQIRTQDIREDDDRGRHTTTHRELHVTPTGAYVIDTPGLRQVGLTEDMSLTSTFSDIATLANQCKFGDCNHDSEPGCAIQKARAEGALDEDHWQNFLKLQKEIAFERRKADKALQSQEKKKWAKLSMSLRVKNKIRAR